MIYDFMCQCLEKDLCVCPVDFGYSYTSITSYIFVEVR